MKPEGRIPFSKTTKPDIARDVAVLALRSAGKTYTQITNAIGCSPAYAHKIVTAGSSFENRAAGVAQEPDDLRRRAVQLQIKAETAEAAAQAIADDAARRAALRPRTMTYQAMFLSGLSFRVLRRPVTLPYLACLERA